MKDTNTVETPKKKSLKKQIIRRLPFLSWARKYTKTDLVSDLIAGTTVGLTVVPQSMAYAAIAGLSPEYGLYSSYLGVLVYVILGSCVQATIGPTAVMGLLTFQTCGQDYPSCAILTGFYAGVFELILAVLRLGWVVSFISDSVTVGFTAGAAVTIMSSQVKSLFGMSGAKGEGFVGYWKAIFDDITTFKAADSIVGIVAFICLLLLRKLKDMKISNNYLKTALWLISLSRNVIIILITSMIAFIWKSPPFKLVGKVNGGFPPISFPPFLLPLKNTSTSVIFEDPEMTMSFIESWKYISTGPIVIALISILQNVAISKAFGSGQKVDATQEMIALGTASTLGGFVSSIPISASFSRSAVNEASGVRSPLGGLFTGILVLLSLGFLTPSFYYIPKASLAAVIIAAVMFMVEYDKLLPMWKISKMDAVACLATFLSSLLVGMEFGILIGVGISLASLLYSSLRPKVDFSLLSTTSSDSDGNSYLLISPARSSPAVSFPCVDHISSTVQKIALKHKSVKVLVLDCSLWASLDYTAATSLVSVVKGLRKNGQTLLLLNVSQASVDVLSIAGLTSDSSLVNSIDMESTVNRICSEESTVLKEVLEGPKSSSSDNGVRDRSSSSVKSGSAGSSDNSDSDAHTTSTETAVSESTRDGSVIQLVK